MRSLRFFAFGSNRSLVGECSCPALTAEPNQSPTLAAEVVARYDKISMDVCGKLRGFLGEADAREFWLKACREAASAIAKRYRSGHIGPDSPDQTELNLGVTYARRLGWLGRTWSESR